MPRRIIDISVALKAGIASDPPYMLPSISYLDHKAGAENFVQVFPGLKREQLPDQAGPAVENVAISTHNGISTRRIISIRPWTTASRPRGDAFPAQPGRPRHRHERLELGRAVQLHGEALRRNRQREPDLGRTQGRSRDRLLPHGEAVQPRRASLLGLQGSHAFR